MSNFNQIEKDLIEIINYKSQNTKSHGRDYSGTIPNENTKNLTKEVFRIIRKYNLLPERVLWDADGGIVFRYKKPDNKEIKICISNDYGIDIEIYDPNKTNWEEKITIYDLDENNLDYEIEKWSKYIK